MWVKMDLSEYFNDKPNYDYWLLLDSWSKKEASFLFCGLEAWEGEDWSNDRTIEMDEIITSGVYAKTIVPCKMNERTLNPCFFRPQDVIKWAIKKGLDIPKELVDWYDQYKKQKNSKQVIEQLDLERENYRLMAIENESLKKQLAGVNETESDVTTRERNTFLRLIAVMAKKGYGNDLSEPHTLANEISKDAELLGIDLKSKTVAEKLKEAKILLPDSV
jgi:hypothetical protein